MHQRAVDADEIYGDWLRAHDAMRESLASFLDTENPGTLEEIVACAMERLERECARSMGNLEAATWMAEHEPEGFFHKDYSIAPEEAESVHRTLNRSDRLGEAIEVVYRAPGLAEGKRWTILTALYEAKDQAGRSWRALEGRNQPRAPVKSSGPGLP
jgi:hypothetical protein